MVKNDLREGSSVELNYESGWVCFCQTLGGLGEVEIVCKCPKFKLKYLRKKTPRVAA